MNTLINSSSPRRASQWRGRLLGAMLLLAPAAMATPLSAHAQQRGALISPSSGQSVMEIAHAVTAQLHEVPLLVNAGDQFRIRGTGFSPNEAISFTWDGVTLPDWHATTDALGNFPRTYGHVPGDATPNLHLFVAHGLSSGKSAQVRITVGPAALHSIPLLVSPDQVFPVRGTAFGAWETITFTWDGAVLPNWHTRANAQGAFGYGGTIGHVPNDATPGSHILVARGVTTGRTAQVNVTVAAPAIQWTATSITRGQAFPLRGTGFGAGETITFTWDGVVLPNWHTQANAKGAFGFGGTIGHVPNNAAPGSHVLAAHGQSTGRTAQIVVSVANS
jgi:hypothetical protein